RQFFAGLRKGERARLKRQEPSLSDERYYFADLASAIDFYLEGWKERQLQTPDGSGQGLDHSGLYSRGRLIHGRSIHGDVPGHAGENLRRVLEQHVRELEQF
ncbi:MAG TPA: hypothetical protein VEI52_25395, partial [Terriglobales bacterium]|nr:hypothetical protein [Terriglobales bacterium]